MFERLRRTVRGNAAHVADQMVARYRQEFRRVISEESDRVIAELRAEADRAVRAVAEAEFRARRDVNAAGEREAVMASALFAQQHMPTVPTFAHSEETLKYALTLVPEKGMALEFGVYSGSTLRIITEARVASDVYGFDSFQGLPEAWRPNIPAGAFHVAEKPDVPGAELVVGWFDDSLPPFMAEHSGPVTFLHVDCDLYSSTVTVLDHVGPRLVAGSVVVFDEYWNYPGWLDHEHKAWMEYVERTGTKFEYVSYTSNDEQVAVRVTEVAGLDQ